MEPFGQGPMRARPFRREGDTIMWSSTTVPGCLREWREQYLLFAPLQWSAESPSLLGGAVVLAAQGKGFANLTVSETSDSGSDGSGDDARSCGVRWPQKMPTPGLLSSWDSCRNRPSLDTRHMEEL